jgi:hypothetical protein
MAAHYLIHESRRPVSGSFALIHAAAGGMGGLLVHWAKHLGANVIGTVSTEVKALSARTSGADHVVLYTAATISKLAVITQTPKEFDFPTRHLPTQFHYAGPFHDNEGREPVPFPWEKLTRKPLIYASMGTLVNGQKKRVQDHSRRGGPISGHAGGAFGR